MTYKRGDRVKLVSYEAFSDYKKHRGETATIIDSSTSRSFTLAISIQWDNEDTSNVSEDNLVDAKITDWKRELLC